MEPVEPEATVEPEELVVLEEPEALVEPVSVVAMEPMAVPPSPMSARPCTSVESQQEEIP